MIDVRSIETFFSAAAPARAMAAQARRAAFLR